MQSIDGRQKKFSGQDLTQTGTIFGAELSNIRRQHNLTVVDFKMNGNHCLSDFLPLRKHAHMIYRNFLSSKIDNFQRKIFDIFLIFAQNIDCGYTLEPPH